MDPDPDDPEHKISHNALAERLVQMGFKDIIADELATACFIEYGKDAMHDTLNFAEWCDLVTQGQTNIDAVIRHLAHLEKDDETYEARETFVETRHFSGRKRGYDFCVDGPSGMCSVTES